MRLPSTPRRFCICHFVRTLTRPILITEQSIVCKTYLIHLSSRERRFTRYLAGLRMESRKLYPSEKPRYSLCSPGELTATGADGRSIFRRSTDEDRCCGRARRTTSDVIGPGPSVRRAAVASYWHRDSLSAVRWRHSARRHRCPLPGCRP